MESWLELARREAREAKPRARDVKGHGIHYTPRELADFLARRLVAQLELTTPQIAVLDPASGFLLVLREGSRDLRRTAGPLFTAMVRRRPVPAADPELAG